MWWIHPSRMEIGQHPRCDGLGNVRKKLEGAPRLQQIGSATPTSWWRLCWRLLSGSTRSHILSRSHILTRRTHTGVAQIKKGGANRRFWSTDRACAILVPSGLLSLSHMLARSRIFSENRLWTHSRLIGIPRWKDLGGVHLPSRGVSLLGDPGPVAPVAVVPCRPEYVKMKDFAGAVPSETSRNHRVFNRWFSGWVSIFLGLFWARFSRFSGWVSIFSGVWLFLLGLLVGLPFSLGL